MLDFFLSFLILRFQKNLSSIVASFWSSGRGGVRRLVYDAKQRFRQDKMFLNAFAVREIGFYAVELRGSVCKGGLDIFGFHKSHD